MEMLAGLFRFLLLSAGVTYLITRSVIFSPIRKLIGRHAHVLVTSLMYCPSCCGFWVGAALAFFWPWWSTDAASVVQAAVAACALCSVLSPTWEAHYIQRELEAILPQNAEFEEDGEANGTPKEG